MNARQLIEDEQDDIKNDILSSIPEDEGYEWRDFGIVNSSYFQGAGTSGTEWDAVYVGIGDNPKEAAEDALEQAVSDGWEDLSLVSTAAIPEVPSVVAEQRRELRSQVDDAILATNDEEAINDAIDELIGQDDGSGNETYYHIGLYVKKP